MSLNIAVIYGSVRSQRQGIKAAKFFESTCKKRGHTATLIDPIEYDLPLLDKMYKEYTPENAPENLKKLAEVLKQAEAYIVVCAEYNHSIPPALSNLIDHFMEEYFWKPSAIVSYSAGSFGGVRAAMQLRAMLAEVGTPSIPSMFPIPKVQDAFSEDGKALDDAYNRRVEKFMKELEWYATALKSARDKKDMPY